MKARCRVMFVLSLWACRPAVVAFAQQSCWLDVAKHATSSNAGSLPESPAFAATAVASPIHAPGSRPPGMRPFSALSLGLRAGGSGVGLEVATPLANRINLRAGGNLLNISPHFIVDGMKIASHIQLRSGFVAVDLFPSNGAFHISPGYTLYNGNHLAAQVTVPAGQSFDLGDATYFSGPGNPVHGTFDLNFGRKSAPRLTLGWGNMIPRRGGHWSFPFEIGAEYLGKPPGVTLSLAGTVCEGPGSCQPIQGNPSADANVAIEQSQINASIPAWLRFYPLISTGISYRFGHSPDASR